VVKHLHALRDEIAVQAAVADDEPYDPLK
jgi:hypothetical protein